MVKFLCVLVFEFTLSIGQTLGFSTYAHFILHIYVRLTEFVNAWQF